MEEQHQVAQQEKDDLHTKFEEERVQVKKEREQFLAQQLGVKEEISRELHSVIGLEKKAEELVEQQVVDLVESIQ
jgi:hypothetical protein